MVKGKRANAIPPANRIAEDQKELVKPIEVVKEPESAALSQDAFPRNGQEKFNIYIADGKLDTAPMRDKGRERLKAVLQESLRDPDLKHWLGLSETQAEATRPELVSPLMMRGLWETVANVQAQVYAKKTGLTFERVKSVVGWNEAELALLSGQSAGLANKYIPLAWLQYSDVALFLLTVVSLMKAKASALADVVNRPKQVAEVSRKTEVSPEPNSENSERVSIPPQTDSGMTHGAVSSIGVTG